jgi:hypothetical protein
VFQGITQFVKLHERMPGAIDAIPASGRAEPLKDIGRRALPR